MKGSAAAIDPVIKSVRVSLDIDSAFRLFTEGMSQWWPLETHSIAADTHEGRLEACDLVFEGKEGGRIYETLSDGSQGTWGRVLAWEPPRRVVFSWRPSLTEGPHTEVEVRFSPAEGGTEVELEHRGWERFGEEGAGRRREYETGWPRVLERFRTAV